MKTDTLFYRLFQTFPRLLFDLIGQDSAHAESYRFDSVELKQTAFRLDGVFVPPTNRPDWPLFFIEVQFQLDPDFYARLFAEIFLYLRAHRPTHSWQAVVLYPTRATDPGDHPHYRVLLQSEQVVRVYLDEWVAEPQTLTQHLMAVVLAEPQAAAAEAQVVAAQVRQELVDTRLRTTIVELLETILVYKLPALSRQEIQTMLGITDLDLKQTRFYQEVFAEGRQEGRQEGQKEGETALVRRLLRRRCGVLPSALEEQILRLNAPQLEALGEALFDFNNAEDLEQWLTVHRLKDSD